MIVTVISLLLLSRVLVEGFPQTLLLKLLRPLPRPLVWQTLLSFGEGDALMWKSIIFGLLGCVALCGEVSAACPSFPYTLTNNTPADATQVMANFNCVLGSPVFSGPVGVGMTPTHALDIGGTSGVTVAVLNNDDNGRGGFLSATGASGSGTFMVSSNSAGYGLIFGVDGVEQARISTDGSFLAGTTTHGGWNGDAKLAVQGSGPAVVSFYQTNNNAGYRAIEARVDFTNIELMHLFYTNNSVGSITTNGTGVTYGSASDRRLKTNIKPLGAGISLKALKAYDPSDYRLRSKYSVGAVAQWVDRNMRAIGIDAAEIGLVRRGDGDIHRKPTDKAFVQWQMDSSKMMPYAIRTVLDHETRIGALEQDISKLRAANDNQAAEIHELKVEVSALERKAGVRTAER